VAVATLTAELDVFAEVLAAHLPQSIESPLGDVVMKTMDARVAAYFKGLVEHAPIEELSKLAEEKNVDAARRRVLDILHSTLHDLSDDLYRALYAPAVVAYTVSRYAVRPQPKRRVVREALDPRLAYGAPIPAQAAAWARTHCALRVTGINTETQSRIADVVAEGIERGQGVVDMGNALQREFGDMSIYRARLIANTETNDALSRGAEDRAGAMGASEQVWITSTDERVCRICQPNERQGWIPFGQSFTSGHRRPPAHPNCFSSDTEVFTETGWKPIAEVKPQERLWTLRSDGSLAIELDSVRNAWANEHTSDMVHLQSRTIDLLVTPDHDMPVITAWRGKHQDYQLFRKTVSELCDSDRIPRIGFWSGNHQDEIHFNGCGFPAGDFMEFLGWYIAEGSICKHDKGGWQVVIAQEKPEGRERIEILVSKLFSRFWKGRQAFSIPLDNATEMIEWFRLIGKGIEKHIPKELLLLDSKLLQRLFDGLIGGDGSRRTRPWKGHEEWNFAEDLSFYTSSPQLANDMTELSLKIGRHPSFSTRKPRPTQFKNGVYTSQHDGFVFGFGSRRTSQVQRIRRETETYRGLIYGIEMQNNPVLFVRRNGKAIWAGNCRCAVGYRGATGQGTEDVGGFLPLLLQVKSVMDFVGGWIERIEPTIAETMPTEIAA